MELPNHVLCPPSSTRTGMSINDDTPRGKAENRRTERRSAFITAGNSRDRLGQGWLNMLTTILLSAALGLGQASAPPVAKLGPPQEESQPAEEKPAEDKRGFLMKALGPTCFGACLDAHK